MQHFPSDCYKLLSLQPDAGTEDIRRACRIKAKLVHPDVNSSADAAAQFRRLQEAAVTNIKTRYKQPLS